jgi:hypothetical protein
MCHPFRIQDDDDGAILYTYSKVRSHFKTHKPIAIIFFLAKPELFESTDKNCYLKYTED